MRQTRIDGAPSNDPSDRLRRRQFQVAVVQSAGNPLHSPRPKRNKTVLEFDTDGLYTILYIQNAVVFLDPFSYFIILDEAKCYLMGASIKDAGNKGFAIVALEDAGVVSFILNYATEVWASATLL